MTGRDLFQTHISTPDSFFDPSFLRLPSNPRCAIQNLVIVIITRTSIFQRKKTYFMVGFYLRKVLEMREMIWGNFFNL